MPVINGIDFIEAIKRKSSETKCVIISAYKDFDVARKALVYKSEDYLLKPLHRDDILNILRKIKNDFDTTVLSRYLIDLEDKKSIDEVVFSLRKIARSRYCCIIVSNNPLGEIKNTNFLLLNIKDALMKVWFYYADEKITFPDGMILSRWHTTCDELMLMICEAAAASNGGFIYSSHTLVSEIQLYIGIHYNKKESLKKIAGKFCVSESYLCELFKKQSGDTVFGFYIKTRLHNARRLLQYSAMSMKEIAQASGFNDYSYFNRSFKKLFGFTPEALRKSENKLNPAQYPFPVIAWESLPLRLPALSPSS
jgi:two-component system response regulator YesN